MIPTDILVATKKVSIPPRLFHVVNVHQSRISQESVHEDVENIITKIEHTDDISSLSSHNILDVAQRFYEKGETQLCILYLGVFASHQALSLLDQGKTQESLGILTDALTLEHQVLPDCGPEVLRVLTRRISIQADEAVRLSAALGSVDALLAARNDVVVLLAIIDTVWGPAAGVVIQTLKKTIDELCQFREDKQLSHTRSIMKGLGDARKILSKPSNLPHKRNALFTDLVDAWVQVVQQETILMANAQYSSEGLDYESIARQSQRLIGQVEQRLRALIIGRYKIQYRQGWLDHIRSQHKAMYDNWTSNQQRDQAAFRAYRDHTPTILEYARFEDLSELITSQWHLFRETFDFGYDARNKAVFYDKMSQIAKVRNPLAHHRTIPENELLRARVLCTDILLALDRSGAGLDNGRI